MRFKKFISFFIILSVLFTMNITPTFADPGNRSITITVEGNGTVEVKVSGTVRLTVSSGETATYTGLHNETVTLTAIADDGSEFVRWTNSNNKKSTDENPTDINDSKDIKITAIFEETSTEPEPEPETYTITTNVIGNGSVSVSVNGTELTGASPYTGIADGANVTITANADSGNHFVGWSGDVTGTVNPYTISAISGNYNITATFEETSTEPEPEPETYTITTSVIGNGSVTVSVDGTELTGTSPYTGIADGANVTITANAGSGSQFVGWSEDVTGTVNPYTISAISGNYNITATFEETSTESEPEPETYTITTSVIGNGSVTVSVDGTELTGTSPYTGIADGANVTITANAGSGNHFVGWSGDVTGTVNPYTISAISGSYNITATFEKTSTEPEPEITPPINPTVYYSLNVVVEGPGSVTPITGTYSAGSLIALSPLANEGAQFVGWFGVNGSEVSGTNVISMTGNKSLIARFELIPPVDVEEVEDAEDIKEVEEEFEDDVIPESGSATDEGEIVLDHEVPYDGPSLPQTGGIPMELLVATGFAFITAGISLKKKEEKKK